MLGRIRIAVVLAAVATALAAAPANATHVPGGIYKGSTDAGGSVEFTVSEDGTKVDGWSVEGIPGTTPEGAGGGPCTAGVDYSAAVETIVDEHFEFQVPLSSTFFEGTFNEPGVATGTLDVADIGQDPPCNTPVYTWTAKLSGNVNEVCEKARARLKKAKKQLKKADSPQAKEKAKKKVKKVEKDVALFCTDATAGLYLHQVERSGAGPPPPI